MRFDEPAPGDPWPHDMIISVESSPHSLLELLWVREVWGLEPEGDIPPGLDAAPPPVHSAARRSDSDATWMELWTACLQHTAREPIADLLDRLQATADGSPERAELLRSALGPNVRDHFGDTAFDESFVTWQLARQTRLGSRNAAPLEQTPERRALHALVPAWHAGLRRIITIPCRGEHTRIVGSATLLLTEETHGDTERYTRALSSFG